jgi:hypothetical protein
MPAYDSADFQPAAPCARVVIRNSAGLSVPDVAMLIDSGADATLVCLALSSNSWA